MAFTDRELTCRDCGSSFVFSAGEQEFYAGKGLQHDPVRCPSCRAQRKLMRPEDRDDSPNYGVYVSWGGRTPRQLHVATCAQCAQTTEVPFVPRGDRPVYCSNCYNDVRSKQEAQETAEAEAAAARIAFASGRPDVELEGEGPSEADAEAAAAVAAVELEGESPSEADAEAAAAVAAVKLEGESPSEADAETAATVAAVAEFVGEVVKDDDADKT